MVHRIEDEASFPSRSPSTAVFGPKNDRWQAYTVVGRLAGNGVAQILATFSPAGVVHVRHVGMVTVV